MSIFNKLASRYKKQSKNVMLTSFSDNLEYPEFCKKASNDDVVFSSFRRNPAYNKIVELLTEEQGAGFLKEIELNVDSISEIEKFKKNDLFGYPRVYGYPVVGDISPTTLMYIKIIFELENIFGALDGFEIVEVGVGYGGQARIINEKFNIRSYSLLDLDGPLALASKYLGNFEIQSDLFFETIGEISEKKYDLFISNFAFTELRRSIQEEYLYKIILHSKRGYLIYNDINPEEFNSFKKEELLNLIPNSRIITEEPLTSPKNCIIIWGEQS
jgi:hypothetical protein